MSASACYTSWEWYKEAIQFFFRSHIVEALDTVSSSAVALIMSIWTVQFGLSINSFFSLWFFPATNFTDRFFSIFEKKKKLNRILILIVFFAEKSIFLQKKNKNGHRRNINNVRQSVIWIHSFLDGFLHIRGSIALFPIGNAHSHDFTKPLS